MIPEDFITQYCDNTLVGSYRLSDSSVCPSVCPSVNTYFMWRDISVLSGRILMKLGTNIHHVSGNCWKCFQGQRSKVKVICVQLCECYNGGGILIDGVLNAYRPITHVKILKIQIRLYCTNRDIVMNFVGDYHYYLYSYRGYNSMLITYKLPNKN